MTETKSGTTALAAYKAGQKEAKAKKKKTNVYYFPIGRSIATLGGVFSMVSTGNIKAGLDSLWDGDWNQARHYLSHMFDGGDVKKGAKMIATGIVLGKSLDATKANPRLKMGKYGIKLV